MGERSFSFRVLYNSFNLLLELLYKFRAITLNLLYKFYAITHDKIEIVEEYLVVY